MPRYEVPLSVRIGHRVANFIDRRELHLPAVLLAVGAAAVAYLAPPTWHYADDAKQTNTAIHKLENSPQAVYIPGWSWFGQHELAWNEGASNSPHDQMAYGHELGMRSSYDVEQAVVEGVGSAAGIVTVEAYGMHLLRRVRRGNRPAPTDIDDLADLALEQMERTATPLRAEIDDIEEQFNQLVTAESATFATQLDHVRPEDF
jgi:hypothetical protein